VAKPTEKNPQIDKFLEDLMGFSRKEAIKQDKCIPPPIGCGGPADRFHDPDAEREYRISGLCQRCQNKIFGS